MFSLFLLYYLLFRSKKNPGKPVKLNADGQYKPHVNSFVKQVLNISPVRKASPVKSHVSPMAIAKKEITTPVSFFLTVAIRGSQKQNKGCNNEKLI